MNSSGPYDDSAVMPFIIHEQQHADAAIKSASILRCQKQGDWRSALSLLQQMLAQGMIPTLISFNAVCDTCCKCQQMGSAEWAVNRMQESGVAPDVFTFTTFITAYGKAQNVEMVLSCSRSWRKCMWYLQP